MLPASVRKYPALVAILLLGSATLAVLGRLHDAEPPVRPPQAVLEGHEQWVQSLAFAPDGRLLASAGGTHGRRGEVKLWDLITATARFTIPEPTAEVQSVAFSPDTNLLAAGRSDGLVQLLDVATGRQLAVLTGHMGRAERLAFSTDGTTLAVSARAAEPNAAVTVWDVRTGERVAVHERRCLLNFSPDGRTLATLDDEYRVWFRDRATGAERVAFQAPVCLAHALAFAEEGPILATSPSVPSLAVRLWDLNTESERGYLDGHELIACALAFAPDGRTLVTGSNDRTIKLWDVPTGQARASLSGHTGSVYCVAISPDGRLLASGGFDRSVRLWSLTP
jgi:WD40 repeat protein